MYRKHVPLDLAPVPGDIHQDLPAHDPQSQRARGGGGYPARALDFFDGVDDAADDGLAVRGSVGRVGAVDGGLDDGVLVADGVNEGGVRGGVALEDMQVGVRA